MIFQVCGLIPADYTATCKSMVEDYGKEAIATLASKVGPAVSTPYNFQPFLGISEEERMLSHTFSKKCKCPLNKRVDFPCT